MPGVGLIAEQAGCMFIDRADTSGSKKGLMEKIDARQKLSEEGKLYPLIINPEGGTTNGSMLIKFKRGAFAGLHSVQPICIKYHCPFMRIESGAMPMVEHMF